MPNVADLVTSLKATKEQLVSDRKLDRWDLLPHVVFWRADREVAHAIATRVDRDMALAAAGIGVPAYGADCVVMVSDSYGCTEKWFRDRKRSPKPGELARVWAKGRDDLVFETLAVVWATRIGGVFGMSAPYVVDKEARTVTWTGDWDVMGGLNEEGTGLAGYVPDSLAKCFRQGDFMLALHSLGLRPEDFDLTDTEARFHADVAVTKVLASKGHMVLMCAHSEKEARIVERSLEDYDYIAIGPNGKREHRRRRPEDN